MANDSRTTTVIRVNRRTSPGFQRASMILLCYAAVLVSAAFPVAAGARVPVLGSKFFQPGGVGFGHAHPSLFSNGGDPSGTVTKVHWTHWGWAVATGIGLNAIFQPGGGYYPTPARIELRASDLGSCGDGIPAYRRLEVRVPKIPGGPLGPWFSWSGRRTMCPAFATKAAISDEAAKQLLCGLHGSLRATHDQTIRAAVVDGKASLLNTVSAINIPIETWPQVRAAMYTVATFTVGGRPVDLHSRVKAGVKIRYEISHC